MARINLKEIHDKVYTAEGAPAKRITPLQQLKRSVMSCLLWEKEFYEDGTSIADRVWETALKCKASDVADVAWYARHESHLRHVPLLLLCAVVRLGDKKVTEHAIAAVISRADEMAEFIAMYWARPGNKHMIPHQMQRGLQRAVVKFDEYQLAKYDRDGAVKLRDVFRLVRPVPGEYDWDRKNRQSKYVGEDGRLRGIQKDLWHRAVKGELKTPDTWEVALSRGDDKKKTFERLIREGQLGYFALLRNLKGMLAAGVDEGLVREAIVMRESGADRVLPFRFIAAARAAPTFEPELDIALGESLKGMPMLMGKTIVLVDVSGSMDAKLSGKSDLTRLDAAAALASICPGEKMKVLTFSNQLVEVPPRRGMAGIDAIIRSQRHGNTDLRSAMMVVNTASFDRLIVITDEQANAAVPAPTCAKSYLINVASNKNGIGYGKGWSAHIDGFSENVLKFIATMEKENARDDV